MQVNLLPAVQAYCAERLLDLGQNKYGLEITRARIDELDRVLSLCAGLEAQQPIYDQIVTRALAPDQTALKP